MKVLRKIPKRLPSERVIIRKAHGSYAIWTGRIWFGSIDRTYGRSWQPQYWMLTTPGSPCETFTSFEGACTEAERRAIFADGGRPVLPRRSHDIDPVVTLDSHHGYAMFHAIDRNTYDVDCNEAGFFSTSPTGYGRTPLDAIVDLLDNMDAR